MHSNYTRRTQHNINSDGEQERPLFRHCSFLFAFLPSILCLPVSAPSLNAVSWTDYKIVYFNSRAQSKFLRCYCFLEMFILFKELQCRIQYRWTPLQQKSYRWYKLPDLPKVSMHIRKFFRSRQLELTGNGTVTT